MDKLKTKILLISLLLVLLFSVQSVSASTDDNGNLTSESIDLPICDNTGDIISDKLSNNPDDILNMQNELDEINSDEDSHSTSSTINISKDNRIADGKGAVIDMAEPTTQAFNVDGRDVTIKNAKYNSNGVGAIDSIYSSTNENIKAGTFTDLADKIFDAISNHDGTLNLTYDFAYDADIDKDAYILGIRIEGNAFLTINGNNHTISGSELSGIFNIDLDDGVTTFNDITFTNAYAGAIIIYSKLIINNCTFINNINFYDGGYDEGCAVTSWNADTTLTNCVFINNTASDGGAIFIEDGDATLDNCVFINNAAVGDGIDSGVGGAISYDTDGHTLSVNNCVFTNNIASTSATSPHYAPEGGAIDGSGSVIITNSNFTDNSADIGGAIWMYSGSMSVENCNFIGNNASSGSAIYFNRTLNTNSRSTFYQVSNSRFLNNRADADKFYVTKNKDSIAITFTGGDNLLNAIFSDVEVSFTNVTYWGAKGITNTGSSPIIPSRSNKEAGQNITVVGVVNGNVLSATKVTDDEGKIVLEDVYGVYKITVLHDADSYYTKSEKTIVNKINTKVSAEDISGNASEKTDIKVKIVDENGNPVKNGTVELTIDGKTYTAEVVDGAATFKDVVLPEKDTVADVYYHGNDYYNSSSTTFSIKVKHNNTEPDSNDTDESKTTKHVSSKITDTNATGNPITMMLLALFVMVITYRKK